MKNTAYWLFMMVSLSSTGQIHIGSNTDLYVGNEVLFIKENLNLPANSNLYLRRNAQLIQGTAALSANTGTGSVSVYQEGTSDNFEYNYWCAPVGDPAMNTTGNNPFGISLLGRPASLTSSSPAILLPLANYNGTANPLAISTYWIYKLTAANSYSQWIQVAGATSLSPGEGFTMKGTSGSDPTDPEANGVPNNPGTGAQRYDFRGKPNDGNISVGVGSGNAATLTGNPYPSALDLNAFLLDPINSACTRIAYFWEQDRTTNSHYLSDYRGGYGTYSPGTLGSNGVYVAATFNSYNSDGSLSTTGLSSGSAIARRYAPIGQGFLINGNSQGLVTFKNAHRTFYREGGALSQFGRSAGSIAAGATSNLDGDIPHFKINTIINGQFTRQLALAFLPDATDGVDYGIDAINTNQDLPADIAFLLDDASYVIQGLQFDVAKRIPLVVRAAAATSLKFYVPELIDFNPSQDIFLFDALDGTYHDIKSGSYEAAVAAGTHSSRFEITFADANLGTNDEVSSSFLIIQDNEAKILKALNPDNNIVESFYLYDIQGRVILHKHGLGNADAYTFSTSGFSEGVYIAAFVLSGNRKTTCKIILTN